jgi:hypothetical protein
MNTFRYFLSINNICNKDKKSSLYCLDEEKLDLQNLKKHRLPYFSNADTQTLF